MENKKIFFFFKRFTALSISECPTAFAFGSLVSVKWVPLSAAGRYSETLNLVLGCSNYFISFFFYLDHVSLPLLLSQNISNKQKRTENNLVGISVPTTEI